MSPQNNQIDQRGQIEQIERPLPEVGHQTRPIPAGAASAPGSPVASPLGTTPAGGSGPVRGQPGATSGPNDPSSPVLLRGQPVGAGGGLRPPLGTNQPVAKARTKKKTKSNTTANPVRVSAERLAQLRDQLAVRDMVVLARIAEHGYVSTDQIQRFVFTEHATTATALRSTRRVLARLERDGLIRSLPRRQGGPTAGSTPATWQLTSGGRRLLQLTGYATSPAHAPGSRWLNHCLAVAEAHLGVVDVARERGRDADVQVEPASWRAFTGIGGEQRWVKPDLAATLTGKDGEGAFEDAWFIEVDLGTESLPTLLRKARQYEAHYLGGSEQLSRGGYPLVLWLLVSPNPERNARRASQFATALTRAGGITRGLHRFATPETFASVLTSPEGQL